MFPTLILGRPFGIRTSAHWSFWLLPAFILLSGFLQSGLSMAVIDTAVVLAIFGCVALHELGHALAARHYGIRTRDIVLYPIGGVARLERMPRSPAAEIAIAIAGPAVNVAIVAILAPLMVLDGYHIVSLNYDATILEVFWTKLLWANVALAAFNLIPAFPMDGGRVLRATLSWFMSRTTATEIAASVGLGFAIVFGLGAVLQLLNPMFFVLALFLALTGQAELSSVRREETARHPTWPEYRRNTPISHSIPEPTQHTDGWVFDPQSRHWALWQNGVIVKRISMS